MGACLGMSWWLRESWGLEVLCRPSVRAVLLQIPGKQLFVLVKRYLCVTSLLDKLSSGVEQGEEEQQGCAVPSPFPEERSRVKQEFEFSMAMANLISELVRAMGWSRGHKAEPLPQGDLQPRPARSIFQHKTLPSTAAEAAPTSPAKEPVAFKTRSAFPSRSSYVEYVQATLVSGMRVRMLEDYEQVSAGDEGEFRRSNDGMPPVQVPLLGEQALPRGLSALLCSLEWGCWGWACRPHLGVCWALLRCTGKLWAVRTGFTGTWSRSLALQNKRSLRARRR